MKKLLNRLLLLTSLLPATLYARQNLDTAVLNTAEHMEQVTDSVSQENVTYTEEASASTDSDEKRYQTWELYLRDYPLGLKDTSSPYAEVNRPDHFAPRNIPDEVINKLKAEKALTYEEPKNKPFKERSGTWHDFMMWVNRNSMNLFYVILGLLGVVLLGGLYQYVANGDFYFRGRRNVQWDVPKAEQEEVLPADFEAAARAAAQEGNFRQAVRYLYLYSLDLLHRKGMVVMMADKTNADYLRELRGNPYYKTFSLLTLAYEYVWFGHMNLGKEQFDELNGRFVAFKNELK